MEILAITPKSAKITWGDPGLALGVVNRYYVEVVKKQDPNSSPKSYEIGSERNEYLIEKTSVTKNFLYEHQMNKA